MLTRAELYHQIDMDDLTLEGLAKHQDDSSREHSVEHHFFAPESADLQELGAFCAKLGFQPSSIERGRTKDGEGYFHFDVVSKTTMPRASVYRESTLMRCLASCYSVGYDGWGTLVQKQV